MKTTKAIISRLILGMILIMLLGCPSPDSHFKGVWVCKSDQKDIITISEIGRKTYEVNIGQGVVFSGEINEDGVLVVEMMGNISRFSIDKGELHFSGIVADCTDYSRK